MNIRIDGIEKVSNIGRVTVCPLSPSGCP